MTNWYDITKDREGKCREIDRQIRSLEKQKREIGTTFCLQVICDLIKKIYSQECRIEVISNEWFLVLFDKSATKKQIQYKRHEVCHRTMVLDRGGGEIEYNRGTAYQWNALPHDIDEVYSILMGDGHEVANIQI